MPATAHTGLHIFVRELDAVSDTPVLDIRPYFAEFGPRQPVRPGAWWMAGYFTPPK